jgi:S-methylmethionine-dependent homocysteine/selenocysteine methylase
VVYPNSGESYDGASKTWSSDGDSCNEVSTDNVRDGIHLI